MKFERKHELSEEGQTIEEAVVKGSDNILVDAVPGAGKSYLTLCAMFRYFNSRLIKPSLLYSSFARANVDAVTPYFDGNDKLNSLGWHQVGNTIIAANMSRRPRIMGGKSHFIITNPPKKNGLDINPFDEKLKKKENGDEKERLFAIYFGLKKLSSLCKLTITDWTNVEELDKLCIAYNVNCNGYKKEIYELLPELMKACLEWEWAVDFDDLVWFPIIKEMEARKYDLVFCDEWQDSNNCQQALAEKVGKRFCMVGDTWQAIYGFAGADTDAMRRSIEKFNAIEFPMTLNFRCGHKIVQLAQMLNPKIRAWDQSPEGIVEDVNLQGIIDRVTEEDMVIARCNKSLIVPCFKVIKSGRKAYIKGKDIAEAIRTMFYSSCGGAYTIAEANIKLERYFTNKMEKLYSSRGDDGEEVSQVAIDLLVEKKEIISDLLDQCSDVNEVPKLIATMFPEGKKDKQGKEIEPEGIKFGTCHSSKGLESDKVYIIDYKNIELNRKDMTDEQRKQEKHLHYVAITRAKKELYLNR